MLHTIADLNNKLNALENEKASLLTITRLLQSELAENNTNYSPSTVQKVSYSKSNNNYCDVATKISKDLSKVKGVSTTNGFSVLDSEEIYDDKDGIVISTASDEDCSVYESKRTERKKSKPARQSAQSSSQNQRKQQSNTNPDDIVDLSEVSGDDDMPKHVKKESKKNNTKNKATTTAKHNTNRSNSTMQLQNDHQQSNGMPNEISNANQSKSTKQLNTGQHHNNSKSRNHKVKTTVRAVLWNSLPVQAVNAKSITQFKHVL